MSCPCDKFVFPPPLSIHAGLSELPRQIATFPEWRRSLLAAVGAKSPLARWRARDKDDFGVMLLEMWAYVCDAVSFYDQVIAQEAFVRTARQRPSVRRLVGLLGYVPRPAVSALATLAAFVDGPQPLTLPVGTAFRSGAFDGQPPQVFETSRLAHLHPGLNRWTLLAHRPNTIGDPPATTVSLDGITFVPGTVGVEADDLLLVVTPSLATTRRVKAVESRKGEDATYAVAVLDAPLVLPTSELIADVSVTSPSATGSLWKQGTVSASGDPDAISGSAVVLDGLYRQIPTGSYVLLTKGADVRWFKVTAVTEPLRTVLGSQTSTLKDSADKVTGSVVTPAIKMPVTRLTLDADINDAGHRTGTATWTASDAPDITLHFGFARAGRLTRSARTTLSVDSPLKIALPLRNPGMAPPSFLLEDRDQDGVAATGALDFASGTLTLDAGVDWTTPLDVPVQLFGNVVAATRGETVTGELLGIGDGALSAQSFKLKKKPLTYLPSPGAGNESGVASTLKVWVGGLKWREVPSFFGARPEDQVYVVRHDDDGVANVLFSGGARPATGAPIVASYRFGAGATAPPVGSIHQLAKAVPGLKSVRNPVAAYGGADAEGTADLARLAPRSALLLGRAVSLPDLEVAAATVGGVRAASAEWRWNHQEQRPVAQIDYIGAAPLATIIRQKLQGLTDPTVPLAVQQAVAVPRALALDLAVDPRFIAVDVAAQARAALVGTSTGLVSPERVGIGRALFHSRIFEAVLAIPGAVGARSLQIDGVPFTAIGLSPGPGHYFDFEQGGVTVNGQASDA